ncbi:MAG TPA: transposase [Pseudonocardiaceae bacterium]|nr:transposase [Pseudonocardiaceae bacterium]
MPLLSQAANGHRAGRHTQREPANRRQEVLESPRPVSYGTLRAANPTATARVRQLSRGGGRKNDRIDAAAAACVAALQGDARPLKAESSADGLALLDERRTNLAQARVRAVNQLHALLRALLAGGAPRELSAAKAAALLRTIRPAGQVERIRKQLAGDLVTEIRALDTKLKANADAMAQLVKQSNSTLTDTIGIGAVTAARLIGRTGRPSRFPSPAAYANYAGTAPLEVASAERTRHRLSRAGDRQLNSALHTIAITQIRVPHSLGNAYYNAKIAEGKTAREATRCLIGELSGAAARRSSRGSLGGARGWPRCRATSMASLSTATPGIPRP